MLRINTHGPWCRFRSFTTVCPTCKKKVFYWECTHGCRVFFEIPLRKPMTRHTCFKEDRSVHLKVEDEEYVFKEIYECAVCNKTFKTESALKDHIKSLKSHDEDHEEFYKLQISGIIKNTQLFI